MRLVYTVRLRGTGLCVGVVGVRVCGMCVCVQGVVCVCVQGVHVCRV